MLEQKQQELLALYAANCGRIEAVMKTCGPRIYDPFYASSVTNYWTAPKRIVFVGQQPGGKWKLGIDPVRTMAWYKEFTDNTNPHEGGSDDCNGPFWSIIRRFEKALGHQLHSSTWLNINRCAEETGKSQEPSQTNLNHLAQLDFLLLEELKILQPDYVVFFTGPTKNYDSRIANLLKGKVVTCDGFNPRQLYQYVSPELKTTIFRTYHPTYLRHSKLESPVFKYIVEQIKSEGGAKSRSDSTL